MTKVLQLAPAPHTPTDSTGASGAASPATRPFSRPVSEFRELDRMESAATAETPDKGGSRSINASGLAQGVCERDPQAHECLKSPGKNSAGLPDSQGTASNQPGPLASTSALLEAFATVIAYQSNSRRDDLVRDWLNREFWREYFRLGNCQ